MVATPNESSVLLVGGPDSGKSNYLFRLWLAICSGSCRLKKNGLPDQLDYLNAGGQALLSGEFAQRTQAEVYNVSVIPVQALRDGKTHTGHLVVPDCWGERWMSIYNKREWSTQWETYISERSGCLLFVRASSDQIVAPLDWVQCEHQWGQLVGEGEQSVEIVTPTQVVLTEWLQFLRKAFLDRLGATAQPHVGIVIAAWDKVPDDRKTLGPTAYVSAEFPLLAQFLKTNSDDFQFEVFGISIAGGDFKSQPGFKDRCLDQADPLSSGYVVYDVGNEMQQSSDLTLPVAWAMDLVQLVGANTT